MALVNEVIFKNVTPQGVWKKAKPETENAALKMFFQKPLRCYVLEQKPDDFLFITYMVLKDVLAVKEKIVGQDILQICPNLFGIGGYIASMAKASPNP